MAQKSAQKVKSENAIGYVILQFGKANDSYAQNYSNSIAAR